MPAEIQDNVSIKVRRSREDSKQLQGISARHWNSAPAVEDEGDSLDAFIVETRLVPVSLSQIPDRLPDNVSLAHKQYICFISLHFISFHFISCHFVSFHFISCSPVKA